MGDPFGKRPRFRPQRHSRDGESDALPQGHPYTPENTYTYPRGSRACRECRRIYREVNADRRREANREYARRKRALNTSRKAA